MLEALQELTRLAVYRETGERSRLMLDISGFRADKRSRLTALGAETAAKVDRIMPVEYSPVMTRTPSTTAARDAGCTAMEYTASADSGAPPAAVSGCDSGREMPRCAGML